MRWCLEVLCIVCDFVSGLLCEIVIWSSGDRNADWTNWWSGELVLKYMVDFRLELFIDSVTERLVQGVILLLDDWATEWLVDWVLGRSADLSICRRRQNFFPPLLVPFVSFSSNFQAWFTVLELVCLVEPIKGLKKRLFVFKRLLLWNYTIYWRTVKNISSFIILVLVLKSVNAQPAHQSLNLLVTIAAMSNSMPPATRPSRN